MHNTLLFFLILGFIPLNDAPILIRFGNSQKVNKVKTNYLHESEVNSLQLDSGITKNSNSIIAQLGQKFPLNHHQYSLC